MTMFDTFKRVILIILQATLVALATFVVTVALISGLNFIGSAPADILALVAVLAILFTLMGIALSTYSLLQASGDFLGLYLLIIGGTVGSIWLWANYL